MNEVIFLFLNYLKLKGAIMKYLDLDRHQKVLVNSYAFECFLNVADQDYIACRIMYRNGLFENFCWCVSQAIEKYLKCILLYNYVDSKDNHNLNALFRKVTCLEDVHFPLSSFDHNFIEEFSSVGQSDVRYGQLQIAACGTVLLDVDHFIWDIRRFCQQFFIEIPGKDPHEIREARVKLVSSAYFQENPQKFFIAGGFLEKILRRERKDILRKNLIWKNRFYSHSRRGEDERCFIYRRSFLYDHPEALAVLQPVITISKERRTTVNTILEERRSSS